MNSFIFNVKKHLKAIIFLCVTALLCFTFSLLNGIISGKSSINVLADIQDEVVKKLDEEIVDSYFINDSAEFPLTVEITDGDDAVTATFGEIILPDGNSIVANSMIFEQLGYYTIRYYFQKDGIIDFAEKQLIVGEKLADISGEGGSITPVTAAQQEGMVFENNSSNVTIAGDDALIIRLQQGYEFQYNKSIDLSKTDANGFIDIISLNYHLRDVIRNKTGFELAGRSANFASIKLTDSYDPTIYVEFASGVRNHTTYAPTTNVMCSVKPYNHPKYSSAQVDWEDTLTESHWQKYYKHPDGKEWSIYSMGEPSVGINVNKQTDFNQKPVTWKYNPTTQMVHLVYQDVWTKKTTERFVFDMTMDNIDSTSNCDSFTGFPSGKVKLSITTWEWAGTSEARFDIFSIGDVSGEELVKEYSTGNCIDDVAPPIIDLGVDYTFENKVYVANNSEFTIPKPVSILGGLSDKNYSVNAYVNYGASAQYEVPIIDGKVTINKPVIYTIKYTANGKNGAVGESLLQIVPKNVASPIILSTDESFFAGNFESGQSLILPEYNLSTINKQDSLKVKIKLVHDNYTKDININSRDFILEYSGEYKIIYEYSDNVFSFSKEYVINANTSDRVGFIDKLVLPKYFIKNANYTLPDLKGYKLGGGEHVEQEVSVEISYDNGENWALVANPKNVKITGDDTVLVKYTCGTGSNVSTIISSPSKIVNVEYGRSKKEGGLVLRDYFIHDGFNIDAYQKELNNVSLNYESKVTSGNNTLEFINAIDYSDFEFRFKLDGNVNYDKVNISLIDYYDSNVKYVLSYTNVGGIGYVSFNGKTPTNTTIKYKSSIAKAWTYDVNSSTMKLDGVSEIIDFRSYFTSPLCYLQIELVDIYGEADFTVDSINYQYIKNNANSDTGAPRISIKDFSGNYKVGDIVSINAPVITDVLSPVINENIKVTVSRASDGVAVSDINGVLLNDAPGDVGYQFIIDSLGEYVIYYTFKDGAGKSVTKIYGVIAVDSDKPVITFNKVAFTEVSVKVGTTIDASFTVTDNVTTVDKISNSLIVRDLSNQTLYSVHHENKLVHFNVVGRYMVYAFAQDEAGNYTYNSFIVNVTTTEVE